MTVPFNMIPQNFLREGSPIPGGSQGYVFTVLHNRMVKKAGRYRYKNCPIDLQENQVCCSLRDIANVTEYSVKVVRTAIKNLQKSGILGIVEGTPNKHNLVIYSINIEAFDTSTGHGSGHSKGTVRAQYGHTESKEDRLIGKDTPVGTAPTGASADQDKEEPKPAVDDLDASMYRLGRQLLGPKSGGQITKLKSRFGLGGAVEVLQAARHKDNPSEYVAGAIHRGPQNDRRQQGNGSNARSSVVKTDIAEWRRQEDLHAKERFEQLELERVAAAAGGRA